MKRAGSIIGLRDIVVALLSASFGPKVAASVAAVISSVCA